MMHKISVIIPVYNVENYLARCVDSVIGQTYGNLEIILVNDGSTDSSGAMCDAYAKTDSRIITLHKRNGGVSEARNTGLGISSGEYIGFVDSDDCISPFFFERMLHTLLETGSGLAFCSVQPFKTEEDITQIRKEDGFETISSHDLLNTIGKNYPEELVVVSWNKLYKKDLFNGFRFPVGKYHEDLFAFFRLCISAEKICYIKERLYYYFHREGSIMNTADPVFILNRQMDRIEARDSVLAYAREQGMNGLYAHMMKAKRNDLLTIYENIPRHLIPFQLHSVLEETFAGASLKERLKYIVVMYFPSVAGFIRKVLTGFGKK